MMCYGLDGRGSIPGSVMFFSIFHIGPGAHPDSYPVGTMGSFLGGEAAGGWRWPLTCT
jgi:hypothetical protein